MISLLNLPAGRWGHVDAIMRASVAKPRATAALRVGDFWEIPD
jgi:hypothetical protein